MIINYLKHLPLFGVLLGLCACGTKVSDTTLIRGSLEGFTADKVSIYVMDYGINEYIDVVDNSFTYELPTNKAVVATVTCVKDRKTLSVPIIPDGFPLSIVFTQDRATQASDNRKSVNYRLAQENEVYHKQVDGIKEMMALKKAGAPKETIDSMDSILRGYGDLLDSFSREDIEYHKDDYLAANALVELNSLTDEQKDSIINTLDPTVIQTERVQLIQKQIHGRLYTKEGMHFIDFSVETDGRQSHLSDYVGKGQYVLADFWASWCLPCIEEFPNLKDVYDKYKGEAFTILGIAVSDEEADSIASIEKYQLPWPQILGTGDVAMDTYGIGGIPHIILFGPDGTILYRGLRGDRIKTVLAEIFGK